MRYPNNASLNELDALVGAAFDVAYVFQGDWGESLGLSDGCVTAALCRKDVRSLLGSSNKVYFTSEERVRIDSLLARRGLCLRWVQGDYLYIGGGHE